MDEQNPNEIKLIRAAIQTFLAQGFTILASEYGEFPRPGLHGNYKPDIVLRDKNGVLHLGEVKTRNGLYAPTTQEQLRSLSSRVMVASSVHSGEPVPLHIIVFRTDVSELIKILQLTNLDQLIDKNIFIHWLDEPES